MWKRIELHNHTVESDGGMTVRELIFYLESQNIHGFSLTDHNTVSGWAALPEEGNTTEGGSEAVRGYELTSYYGHLLCQNLSRYIPWDDIDETCADNLLRRVHEAGGLAGPAHPFAVPTPFSNGMRWTMKIQDYRLVDFIEIINNAHPMNPDNREGILWWERLFLKGYSIAPVSGMDLHRPESMEGFFTTYIYVEKDDRNAPLSIQLDRAVRSCRTCVTRGPVLEWEQNAETLSVLVQFQPGETFANQIESGLPVRTEDVLAKRQENGLSVKLEDALAKRQENGFGRQLICRFRTEEQTLECPVLNGRCAFPLPLPQFKDKMDAAQQNGDIHAVLMLFEGNTDWENFVAASAVCLPCIRS